MSGSIFDALTDPTTSALMGLAQGFGASAMPTRMPTPIGAVLGQGIGGLQQGLATGQALRKGDIQNQQAKIGLDWYKNMMAPQGGATGAGQNVAFGAPQVDANGQYIVSPRMLAGMVGPMVAMGKDPSGILKLLESYATSGTALDPNGNAFSIRGAPEAAGRMAAAKGFGETAGKFAAPAEPKMVTVPDGQGGFRQQLMTPQQQNAMATGGGSPSPSNANLPRGIRNNNPLNLEYREGQPGVTDTDGRFGIYPTMDHGVASAVNQLQRYGQSGLNTIGGIVNKWAPPGENDSSKYAQQVAMLMGAKTDAPLNMQDPNTMARLVSAMGQVENGQMIDPAAVTRGVGMAFGAAPTTQVAGPWAPTGVNAPVQIPPTTPVAASMAPSPMAGVPGPPVLTPQQEAVLKVQTAGGEAAARAPFSAPLTIDVPVTDGSGRPVLDQSGQPMLRKQIMTVPDANAYAANPARPAPGVAVAPVLTPEQEAALKVRTANQMPIELRTGGMQVQKDAQGNPTSIIKNPEHITIENGDGTKTVGHIEPPPPTAPPGTQGTFVPIARIDQSGRPIAAEIGNAVPADVQSERTHLVTEFHGKDTDSYVAAKNTHAWLNQIDRAADAMNAAGGIYNTGPYAASRVNLMQGINDVGRTLGLGSPFSQDTLSNAEELRKATTTAGFELSSHYEGHARQAASTIENATSAVPGMNNSPQGVRLVSAGIREGAQSAIDSHEYRQARLQGADPYGLNPQAVGKKAGAGLETAETDFYKRFTPEMYSTRAISTVHPVTMTAKGLDDFNTQAQKYLPGTQVILNGQPKIIPPRPDAPPIPPYIQNRFMQPQATPNGG